MGWREVLLIAAFLIAWFGLTRWLLPWLGIPTCCSGSCGIPPGSSLNESDASVEPAGDSAPESAGPTASAGGITDPRASGAKR